MLFHVKCYVFLDDSTAVANETHTFTDFLTSSKLFPN